MSQQLINHYPITQHIDLFKKKEDILASGAFTWQHLTASFYGGIWLIPSCVPRMMESTRKADGILRVTSLQSSGCPLSPRTTRLIGAARLVSGREPNQQMKCWLQGLWRGTIRTKSHKKRALNDFLCHLIPICILLILLSKETLFLASIETTKKSKSQFLLMPNLPHVTSRDPTETRL